jgi:hypothetical protein
MLADSDLVSMLSAVGLSTVALRMLLVMRRRGIFGLAWGCFAWCLFEGEFRSERRRAAPSSCLGRRHAQRKQKTRTSTCQIAGSHLLNLFG